VCDASYRDGVLGVRDASNRDGGGGVRDAMIAMGEAGGATK
jgi:hypothetical protein